MTLIIHDESQDLRDKNACLLIEIAKLETRLTLALSRIDAAEKILNNFDFTKMDEWIFHDYVLWQSTIRAMEGK